jgi:radical SAM superfamily enzyme YgiQ (UPF0313 family)
MRVLLISANTEQINIPVFPLGLAFIARATQDAGHDVKLINLMDDDDRNMLLTEGIKDFDPEVIGISVRNIDDQAMENTRFLLNPVKELIAHCRELTSVPIVLGGAGYSIFPMSALNYLKADIGIQGEGEGAFVALLERIKGNEDFQDLPGIFFPKHNLPQKAKYSGSLEGCLLPLPNDHPWIPKSARNSRDTWIPLQTRRGCPMDCNYCSTSTIEGRILKKQSPDYVVDVISRYVEAGYHRFQFVDNTFNLPQSYVDALCDRIIAIGMDIKWISIIYPTQIDERLIEKMAQAGCVGVSLGSESGSNKILKRMNKKFRTKDVRRVSELFKKYGIRQMGFLLFGGPGEDKKSVEESLAFADSLNIEAMKISIGIRIYPFTSLARTAVEEGIIAPDDDLLFPKFYMTKGLEDWLRKTVDDCRKDRPHWMV